MGPRAHELVRRVAVAVVGIPLVLASLYVGGWWFGAVLAAVAMIASAELFGLVVARGGHPYGVTGMAASGAIVLVATAEPTPAGAGAYILAVLVALVLITLTASVWLRWPAGEPQAAVAATLLGSVYVGGRSRLRCFSATCPRHWRPLLKRRPGRRWVSSCSL